MGTRRKPNLSLLHDDEQDELEMSCDIGETTFRKGHIAINISTYHDYTRDSFIFIYVMFP